MIFRISSLSIIFSVLLLSCVVKPDEYIIDHKYFEKMSKKYEKFTTVEILSNDQCLPEYEIVNVFPFVIKTTATCDCAEYNKVYQYYKETTGPENFSHKVMPGTYVPFRVLSDNQFGAVSGTFRGTDMNMNDLYGQNLKKGLYSVVETIELENCNYSVKYTFYYDPSIRFPW